MDAPTSTGFCVALERARDRKHASAPSLAMAPMQFATPTYKGER